MLSGLEFIPFPLIIPIFQLSALEKIKNGKRLLHFVVFWVYDLVACWLLRFFSGWLLLCFLFCLFCGCLLVDDCSDFLKHLLEFFRLCLYLLQSILKTNYLLLCWTKKKRFGKLKNVLSSSRLFWRWTHLWLLWLGYCSSRNHLYS